MEKNISFEDLSVIRRKYNGLKIVHCHGVFDLFHFGHLAHLKSAKKHGDILVTTITPDQFVNKGPGSPRYSAEQRALMLATLDFVDFVAINKFPTAVEAIHQLKPDFYVKGPEYRDPSMDLTGKIKDEADAVHEVGGQIAFTDDDTISTTELLNKYFPNWNDQQLVAIEKIKDTISLNDLTRTIDRISELRVLVVGEPIVDTYTFCQPAGISSKSPTVSARYLSHEDYTGGSMAIANHLKALGCQVTLLITHGNEPYFQAILEETRKSYPVEEVHTPGIPTPRKTRFLTQFQTQRIFELIDLRSDQWYHVDPNPFIAKLESLTKNHDLVIVADYGHGMFESKVLESMQNLQSFVALNVQANSGNFGYNVATKHSRFDYLSIDERECRLVNHDRFTPTLELASTFARERIKKPVSVTLGTAGSVFFDHNGCDNFCPIFFKDVVDTVGAGDAYFAITSALLKQDAPAPIIPFLGNCYAGLKSRIIGNKTAVDRIDLLKTVHSILK